MSVFAGRGAFFAEPHNADLDRIVPAMVTRGFTYGLMRMQAGDQSVNEGEYARFAGAMRGGGLGVCGWVDLEVQEPYDPAWAACVTDDLVGRYDGVAVDAEVIGLANMPAYLAHLQYKGPLMWSCLPTFEAGSAVAALQRRGSYMAQQTYSLENSWTPAQGYRWGVQATPINVGWWYWASISGHVRVVQVTGEATGLTRRVLLVRTATGQLFLDPDTRELRRTVNGGRAGTLLGVILSARFAPTLRTTPLGGERLSLDEAEAQVRAAFGRDPRTVPWSVFLGETTEW